MLDGLLTDAGAHGIWRRYGITVPFQRPGLPMGVSAIPARVPRDDAREVGREFRKKTSGCERQIRLEIRRPGRAHALFYNSVEID